MKKVAWILSVILLANSAVGFGGLVEAKAATTGGNSTYTLSIPQTVAFGNLSTEYNNELEYQLNIEYTDATNTPSITVTSEARGTLAAEIGSGEIAFSNSLSSTTLTSAVSTRTGKLEVAASAVKNAEEGEYVGNLIFAFGLTSGGTSGDGALGEEQVFADGNYYVDMHLWNAYANQASMGNAAFENNQQALVVFEKDTVTEVQFATNPVDISGITSALWELYIDGVAVEAIERKSFTTSSNGYTFNYLARGKFELPDYAQPTDTSDVTLVKDVIIVVPDTVMDYSYPSGEIPARLRFDWSTLEATSDGSIKQDSSITEGEMELEEALPEEEILSDVVTEEGKTTVEITASVTQEGGTISTTITEDSMNQAIENVLAEVEKEGTTPEIKITVATTSTAEALSITLPDTSIKSLAESEGATLVIQSDIGSVVLDQTTLQSLADQSQGAITFEISHATAEGMTDAMTEAVGDAPVFSLQMLSGDSYISSFDGGVVIVSVPYTLPEDVIAEAVVVYHVDDDGVKTARETTYNEETSRADFATGSFSYYMVDVSEEEIIVETWSNPFVDVFADSWFYKAVQYAVENGLFSGTSETTFSPNDEMTRAMLASVLWRLDGMPNRYYRGYSFSDVTEDKYYYDSVLWGAENNLVSGYGNGLFGSDDAVTREQLVVILHRYAMMKEMTAEKTADLSTYTDWNDLAPYATDAFTWAVANGIVSGVGENTLAPKATTTRAQVALVLQKYMALQEIEETEIDE